MSKIRFRSPESQAEYAIKCMAAHGHSRAETKDDLGKQSSIGTSRSYEQSLRELARHLNENKAGNLNSVSESQVRQWLENRAAVNDQPTLDRDRQAGQAWLSYKLGKTVQLDRSEFQSTKLQDKTPLREQSRIYTEDQISRIQARQSEKNALATQIAKEAGLRAKELLTIARFDERPPSDRNWSDLRFITREGKTVTYTVIGKGGLVREIQISEQTAKRLEEYRRDHPVTITDRKAHYESYYKIGGGNSWSTSFTQASHKELGWSCGAHSLRHMYVHKTLEGLQKLGYNYEEAKSIVSQEVGHFSPKTTDNYLR
jgi:integrase